MNNSKDNVVSCSSAFTLVELLVVIGIIGILAAIVMGTFSGGTASARAATCLTNMRNLGAACQSYGMASSKHRYPHAIGGEEESATFNRKQNKVINSYTEIKGWISWDSRGKFPATASVGSCPNLSTYCEDREARLYALTNGCLWKYVSGNEKVYCCPEHRLKMQALNPVWSYVMNAFFAANKYYGRLDRADRILLFAEIPYAGIGVEAKTTTAPGPECDCTLQYDGCGRAGDGESIGVNHTVGKQTFAHVCFADGHVEKLIYPKSGMSEEELKQLTRWLCKGIDVSFDGTRYTNLTQDD